jgi:Fic family protein
MAWWDEISGINAIWLLFFLKGVEQTAKHSIEILNDVLDLKTNLTQTIRGNTGNRANNNLRLLKWVNGFKLIMNNGNFYDFWHRVLAV